ncbi:MAG: DUF2891 domain-containing protein [Planctomycetota bacterium]
MSSSTIAKVRPLFSICLVISTIAVCSQSCATPINPRNVSEPRTALDASSAVRFADLALDCLHREYPNKLTHVLQSDADVKAPRELTPVFCGCFDWHSAVHGHWLLVRLCRLYPQADFSQRARAKLNLSFTPEKVAGEVAYFQGKGHGAFERPYGLAWLLQLTAELREWNDPEAKRWLSALAPLEIIVAQRFREWLPKLSHPIRSGEHSQTAFAFGLALDWARLSNDRHLEDLLIENSRAYYAQDKGWKLAFEPGGQDFLSPGLAEADLMRRMMNPREFAAWLQGFLPELAHPETQSLSPAEVTDKSDGKLAHLDGLNISRAWMLEGIAASLPSDDPRLAYIRRAALEHRQSGLASVTGEHYEGGHWLGSFAVYLVTSRGL